MSKIVKTKNFNKFANADPDSLILYKPDASVGTTPSIFYKNTDSSVYKYSGTTVFMNTSGYYSTTTPDASLELEDAEAVSQGIRVYGMPENAKAAIGDLFVYIKEDLDNEKATRYRTFIKIGNDNGGEWLKISDSSAGLISGSYQSNNINPGENQGEGRV